MLFAIHCTDRPDSAALREANAAAHAAYMRTWVRAIVFGGPLLSEDRQTRLGTMVLVDMPERAAVDEFLADEPYHRAGLFARCEVHAYQLVVERGAPVPTC